jgi:hypothetical protein
MALLVIEWILIKVIFEMLRYTLIHFVETFGKRPIPTA